MNTTSCASRLRRRPQCRLQGRLQRLLQRCGLFCLAALAGCASEPAGTERAGADAHALIVAAIPGSVADRSGWADDILAAFRAQQIEASRENVCAVVSIIDQESNFQVNPVIPELSNIAWKEIHVRAERASVPWTLVHTALGLTSPSGRTYSDRIDRARTEKDLSDIYEDFISSVPLGHTLFESHDPVRTRGPMQVNVAFLKQTPATRSYPYDIKTDLPSELFTRRGSVYFGIAHLLGYQAPYPRYLYRFADYNAGQYSSRNAAFQHAASIASGRPLDADGALLPPDGSVGSTEQAIRSLGPRLDSSNEDIHAALEQGRSATLERTEVYRRIFSLAEQRGQRLPRAQVPAINLTGPKLSRKLTTDWYAHRVDGRFQQCLKRH